jgi:UPF0755 protein
MIRKSKSTLRIVSLVLFILFALAAYWAYMNLYKSNVNLDGKNYKYVYIPSDGNYKELLNALYEENVIENRESFEWMAKKMDLDQNIHPGRYRISEGMNNRQIILMLKKNKQEKVKLTFNSQIHNLDELIEYLDNKLELNSDELEEYLSNDERLQKEYKLNPDNIFALFLPNVYEVSWAINKEDLFSQLKENFDTVWNKDRIGQAKRIGYEIPDVMILASIVQSESGIASEQEKIAGVYINRLKKDMLLQADPTLKFANKNFDARRVTNADKEIDSPYNTYKHKGLPPGPICLVYTSSIDAVLNFDDHDFIFFCAKPDFSGLSVFSSNYSEHMKHAEAYQNALDKKGIKR